MKESLHYLLMADYLLFQKSLLSYIKNTGLTSGQPKVLDYLIEHDGAVQKDIAAACHIEPATLTSVLLGMENKGFISRKNKDGNRRSLYVFLTPTGKTAAENLKIYFSEIEEKALSGFSDEEMQKLRSLLTRINKNMTKKEDDSIV